MKRTIILIISVLTMIITVSGCTTEPTEIEFITLDKELTISSGLCSERDLVDKIIILESKHCGACKIAVPRLQETEQELGAEFIYLDLSENEDRKRLEEFKITPKYTPTVLIGCDVYIGVKPKETYKQLIENFLNK